MKNVLILLLLFLTGAQSSSLQTLSDFVKTQTEKCDHEHFEADSSKAAQAFWQHAFCKEPLAIQHLAASWPSLAKWTDEHLAALASQSFATYNVELSKKERRDDQQALKLPFEVFLNGYRTSNWYFVGQVPDFLVKSGDIRVPSVLHVDSSKELGFSEFPAITMWMSSGGTQSNFHFDDMENVLCVVSGSKEVLLLNPADGISSVDFDPVGLHSRLDVDEVDPQRYAVLKSLRFLKARLNPGDCLYIPFRWFHQINSFERSIAFSFWFYPLDLEKVEPYHIFDQLSVPSVSNSKSVSEMTNALLSLYDKKTDEELAVTLSDFTETVVTFLLSHSPSQKSVEQVQKLREKVEPFVKLAVDANKNYAVSKDEIVGLSHSALTWLFHLERKIFNEYYMSQCPVSLDYIPNRRDSREL